MLYEKYRPKEFGEIVGQDRVVRQLAMLRDHGGLKGRVYWLTANSGQGKTTLARIIASEVADKYATFEVDAQDVGLDTLREWERMAQFAPLGEKQHWCFIVNEAHGLSSKAVSRLQTIVEDEKVQRHSTWIFTTTIQGHGMLFDRAMDAAPFLSRAMELELSHGPELELAFSVRARQIAKTENLDGKPLEDYVALTKECKCNMRKVLQRIESGEMMS